MTDLVRVTVLLADLDDVPAMNAVYTKLMPNPKPARATVKVASPNRQRRDRGSALSP